MFAVVTEVFADSASGVGSQELQGSGLGGSGGNDDGVLQAVALVEQSDDVGHSRALLADGDVDAVKGLGVVAEFVHLLLVDDRVDGDGGLAGLSVSNDQLTLASADWDLEEG